MTLRICRPDGTRTRDRPIRIRSNSYLRHCLEYFITESEKRERNGANACRDLHPGGTVITAHLPQNCAKYSFPTAFLQISCSPCVVKSSPFAFLQRGVLNYLNSLPIAGWANIETHFFKEHSVCHSDEGGTLCRLCQRWHICAKMLLFVQHDSLLRRTVRESNPFEYPIDSGVP